MIGCSNFPSWGKRDVASTDEAADGTKVFRDKDATIEIPKVLEGLTFGDDKANGQSVAKIIAFVNENRDMILSSPDAASAPILRFYPEIKMGDSQESFGTVFADDKSVSVRLQQAIYYYRGEKNGNRQKMYVPFEGADIVAIVKNGKLESLNSSLVVPPATKEAVEMLESASVEDLQQNTPEDRVAVYDSIMSHPDEDDQKAALTELFPGQSEKDHKGWIKRFLTDSKVLFRFIQKSQLKENGKVKLVYSKRSSGSDYELVWRVEAPLGLPLKIFFSADKKSERKFVKSYSLLSDVNVKIYRGFLLKPDLLMIKKGKSEEYNQHPIEKSSPTKQAIVNLSKVVEYFKKDFSWNSYDNQGSDIVATIKMGGQLAQNAAWIGSPYNQFVFGKDGSMLANMTGGLDVIGHEYFHSIVSRTAKLESPGEHGALNEHLADFFGVGFESAVTKKPYDQKIGEAVIVKNFNGESNIGLRDFLNPQDSLSEQARTMKDVDANFGDSCIPSEKNDRCGVHYSNGVLNYVMGKLIQAKGWDSVKNMSFQVVAKRLRSGSDFMDYRNQMLEECKATPTMSTKDCKSLEKEFADVGLAPVASNPNSNVSLPNMCEMIKNSCKLLKDYGIAPTDGCRQCGF